MTSHYSAELIRRCELRHMGTVTTAACAIFGEAVDAGIISLADVLAMVKSCNDANELGDAMATLAASAQLRPVGGA